MSQVSIYQPRLVVGMQRYAGKIRDNYLDELGRNLRIQEKEYEQILEDQRCEEELQKTIDQFQCETDGKDERTGWTNGRRTKRLCR